jgi:hypothetical protein
MTDALRSVARPSPVQNFGGVSLEDERVRRELRGHSRQSMEWSYASEFFDRSSISTATPRSRISASATVLGRIPSELDEITCVRIPPKKGCGLC